MGMPVTTTAGGICFAFPNVCKTPVGSSMVPIPYPSIGQLTAAEDVCDGSQDGVYAGEKPLVTTNSKISDTTGDAAGTGKGVKSQTTGGEVKFTKGSTTVFANGHAVVRLLDPTTQNKENAAGTVLGGYPRVLVG